MKKVLLASLVFGAALLGNARAATLVWCGLDYSHVKMIGTMDFRQPSQIFPGMLEAWNGLFMKEMEPRLEKMAGGSPVESDLDAVEARNEKATQDQIIRQDGTRSEMVDKTDITDDEISHIVKSLSLKHTSGLGLVFVMDRLVKTQEVGALYVVFFDIDSRKMLHSERFVTKAGGAGFRNFWFHPIKEVVTGPLPKLYKQVQ